MFRRTVRRERPSTAGFAGKIIQQMSARMTHSRRSAESSSPQSAQSEKSIADAASTSGAGRSGARSGNACVARSGDSNSNARMVDRTKLRIRVLFRSATIVRSPSPRSRCETVPLWASLAEAVAEAAHGDEKLGVIGILLDLLADPADVDGEDFFGVLLGVAPELFEQPLFSRSLAETHGEEVQQAELFLRQAGMAIADDGILQRRIDRERAEVDRRLRFAFAQLAYAPKMRFHAGHGLVRLERFDDVVVGAEFEAGDAVAESGLRGERNDRNPMG